MEGRDRERKNVIGFNILENECIWMKSGIVAFKRCESAYDCNNCQFDKAMTAASRARKKPVEPVKTFREKSTEKSYADRQCRHMLSGRVAVRKCGKDFRCDICEFDQMMEDIDAVRPIGTVPIIEVDGYRYSDSYYYHFGHSWARVEYGGRVRVGIDDFAWKLLGRPDGLKLPKIGATVHHEETALALEREGHRADVLAPVEGTVLAVNYEALKKPALPHADPYQSGWLYLLEPAKLKRSLEVLYFGEVGREWLSREVVQLHELALGQYGAMAATGAPPVDDVFGQIPEIGWDRLVETFLRTGRA